MSIFGSLSASDFLSRIASAEESQWNEVVDSLKYEFSTSSLSEALSNLNEEIMESNDLDLIKLYQRAVRNHDSLSKEKTKPFTFYYKHYQSPQFLIPSINLTFDIKNKEVIVTTDLTIKKNSCNSTLILDGRDQQVKEVKINGELLNRDQYLVTLHELIIPKVPKEELFTVSIKSQIDPYSNKNLEGMYQCGEWLTTQCESEGARRIFFTLDQPDVLSQITTTIIADKKQYPYRLSNGNLIKEELHEDGRAIITWDDPFPKPSYLFACVLGNFSKLTSTYRTQSGKQVELQIYVEPGKESRASYPLYALEKAMEFDELFFDREYDLSCLKMVGIPDFNSGAMENKGLMIFNDARLLIDAQTGTDKTHREVAQVIGHEYFHNWSGNRVTIRNWFEIALKEAYTDLRATLFSEWLFGSGFVRPKAVLALREGQFPEETSEKGHPIIVESYVDAHAIYDGTTYVKGREIFRALMHNIDHLIPGGFREVQNHYFSKYDGQAVTFKELLTAANDILKKHGFDLGHFERWFHQQGTPILNASLNYDANQKKGEVTIFQSCRHPKTGKMQEPLQIPFSLELIGKNGSVILPKFSTILDQENLIIAFEASEKPTPIFMHGFPAPVILQYNYTPEDFSTILNFSDDPFSQWEAAQKYSLYAIKEMISRMERGLDRESVFSDLHNFYLDALKNPRLSPLTKAQVLDIPSLRTLAQTLNFYDFEKLYFYRELFIKQLAYFCKSTLENILAENPAPLIYAPNPEHMQIRELRHECFYLLSLIDKKIEKTLFELYQSADNFQDSISTFTLCLKMKNPIKKSVIDDFYQKWKGDKATFNFWLSSQVALPTCTVADLRRLETVEGYDSKNPNHVRSILRTFVSNLNCYHDSKGEGYHYLVDKIIEIAQFNEFLAHNYIAVPAFIDFEKLQPAQQALMATELERLHNHEAAPAQTRDLTAKLLQWYAQKKNNK